MREPARRHGSDDEPFELLQELGRGGFATTFRARVLDRELADEFGATEVAIKVPLNRSKERILRKELEINASLHMRLKRLESANLVRYLGFEVFRGQIVMVMEFVPQGSLRHRIGPIGRQRRLPLDQALAIGLGLLSGLAVIHGEQVFHRDIKPENILLDGDTPKIADLGIARLLEADQLAPTQAGTLPYMSPELLSAEGASFTSDLWSAAVTLYEMLGGRLPFGDATTPIRPLVELICRSTPAPLHEVCPDVPRPVSDVITRALSKDPRERYPSAAEMARALLAAVRPEPARPTEPSPLELELLALRDLLPQPARAPEVDARLRALIAAHPSDPRVHQCAGEHANRGQRYKDAIAAFQRAIALAPAQGVLHWHLALALQGAGHKREAVDSLERALQAGLDPKTERAAAALHQALRGAR